MVELHVENQAHALTDCVANSGCMDVQRMDFR